MSTTHICRCGALAACKQQCDKFADKPFPPRYERKKRPSYLSCWKMPNVRELGGLHSIYEKCCTFNARYCMDTQEYPKRKHIDSAIRDFCLLTCFIVANMIVFAAVLTRFLLSACSACTDGYRCARSICRRRRADLQPVSSNVIVVTPKGRGRR